MGPIAKSTVKTSVVFGLRLVVQAGTLLLVARILGAEQFGVFAGVAALAVMMGALANLGTNWVLFRDISESPLLGREVLAWAIPSTILFGTFLIALFVFAAKELVDDASISGLVALTSIGAAEILLQPLYSLAVAEYHAMGKVAYSQMLQIVPLFLRFFAALVVSMISLDEPFFIYSCFYFIASLVSFVFLFFGLDKRWPDFKDWRYPTFFDLKGALGFAVTNFTRLGPGEVDKVAASILLPAGLGGAYTAAVRIVTALTLPVSAMMLSALPRLFRGVFHDDLRLYWVIYASASIYGLLLSVLTWFLSPFFLSIFGEGYESIDSVFRALCFVVPGIVLRLVSGNVLISINKPWARVLVECLAVIFLFVLSLTLVPDFGVDGMVVALAVSEWSMAFLSIFLLLFFGLKKS